MTATSTTPGGIEFLRTPDDRFANLEGFPYEPSYVEVEGLRMGYVDVGPSDGDIVLLLHGEPTWSYLYRRMIPPLTEAGYRCIAPDLVGFGRSDKPTDRSSYTYDNHVRWMTSFLDALDLPAVTLFAQDWGGLIGLRIVAYDPATSSRCLADSSTRATRYGSRTTANSGSPRRPSSGETRTKSSFGAAYRLASLS